MGSESEHGDSESRDLPTLTSLDNAYFIFVQSNEAGFTVSFARAFRSFRSLTFYNIHVTALTGASRMTSTSTLT